MPSGSKDQIIGGGTPTDLPGTIGRLPVYTIGGLNAHISDSVFGQADAGHQVIIGSGASVDAGQVATKPIIIIGEGAIGFGDGAIVIGKGMTGGQTTAKDGVIAIGNGTNVNSKNKIHIGSSLAFGVGTGDDAIAIGTQTVSNGNAGVAIGRGAIATASAVAIGHTASTNGTTEGIAIGHNATAANTGVNHFGIAIGVSSNAGGNTGTGNIAIGHSATATNALSSGLTVIGDGATITAAIADSIAIGHGATTTRAAHCVIGDNSAGPITLFSVRSGAAADVLHSVGASGSWGVVATDTTTKIFGVNSSATGGDIRLDVYDVTAAGLKRVSVNGVDTAGAGFRALRVPN